jgi:serine/threonine protein kinase
MIGQLLTGRYLIMERLGSGGFSETYLARDKYLPHHPLCVVKWLQISHKTTLSLEKARQLFDNEARILERFGQGHRQIPTLLAYCHEQDHAYLVQEYIAGESLGHWVKQSRRLDQSLAIALLQELLPVLGYLHEHQVVHRDIKPSNLIHRQADNAVVLIDFGAAYCLCTDHPDAQPNDGSAWAIGTPGYMPDEQQLGMAQLNSDLYALGLSVIQLLTGIHPRQFRQDLVSGELDWKQAWLNSRPHRSRPAQPLAPELIEILDRMVRSKPSDRYPTPAAVLEDLAAITSTEPAQPLHKPTWNKPPMLTSRKVGRRTLAPAAAVLLVILGGGYVYARGPAAALLNQIENRFHADDIHLTPLRALPTQANIEQLHIAPNSRLLVAVSADHLSLWSLPDGKRLREFTTATPTSAIAISRDSQWLAVGGQNGSTNVWHLPSGQLRQTLNPPDSANSQPNPQPITAIAFSPKAQTLASSQQDGTLFEWDLATGRKRKSLTSPSSAPTTLLYGNSADQLLSANRDLQIQIWDLPSGELKRSFSGHRNQILSLQLVDPHTLLSVGKDRAFLWDLSREELVSTLSDQAANPVVGSMCDRHLMTVHPNGTLRLWVQKNGEILPKGSVQLAPNATVSLSPDHRYLASWNRDRHLQIWRIDTEKVAEH